MRVSKSGFYSWLNGKPVAAFAEDRPLERLGGQRRVLQGWGYSQLCAPEVGQKRKTIADLMGLDE